MGYLSHIVAALVVVVAADLDLTTGWRAPLATVVLLPVPHLLGLWIRRRSLRGEFRGAATLMRLLASSAPLLHAVALCGFGWHDAVRERVGAGIQSADWPEWALVPSLLPFAVFEALAIDARARLFDSRPKEIAGMRRFQLRMFFSGVVPLALYLAIASLVGVDPSVQAHVEEVGLLNALFAGVSIGVFALFLPAILRNTWDTGPIEPGPAREVLDAVARRARFRCKEMRVWKTGHLMANAAIVGFLPSHRVVLFSDSLLAQLGPRELAAVFGHEIGHARRHHVLVFAAWTVAFFLAADLGATALDVELGASWPVSLGFVALLFGLWILGFGYLSRRFELDADLVSFEITGDGDALVRALEDVGGAHTRNRPSWRHFSTAQRVIFLRAFLRDPEVGRRLRAALRRWTRLGVAAAAVTLVAEVVVLSGRWSEDLVAVDLRLGRYGSALARLGAREPAADRDAAGDSHVLALVERAVQAAGPDAELRADELDALAGEALRAGRLDESLDWLELGARRGLERHREVWRRLSAELAGRGDEGVSREGAEADAALLRELGERLAGGGQ